MIAPILQRLQSHSRSFTDYVNIRVPLSPSLQNSIKECCTIQRLPKGTLLLKEGLPVHHLFFIVEGSARTFYHHDGRDVTSWMYLEGALLTSWSSFFMRQSASDSIELLEDAVIESITYDQLQALYQQHPSLDTFGRLMVEEQLAFLDFFYKGFMFMSAKKKYELLLDSFPTLPQRVNLGHIASFLGISQETLSRIRKKSSARS